MFQSYILHHTTANMIFEPQKYQKGTKEMVEFQFFTFVFFVPLVVELKMYSSMILHFTPDNPHLLNNRDFFFFRSNRYHHI